MRAVFGAALLCPLLAIAAEVPIADFARNEYISNVQLSPDGRYVSEVRNFHGDEFLFVIQLSDHHVTNSMEIGTTRRVADYRWASSQRLVITFADELGMLAQPVPTGELVGFDADKSSGHKPTYLFGIRGARTLLGFDVPDGPNAGTADLRMASIIQTLPDDAHAVIVAVNDFPGFPKPKTPEIDRIDIYSGARTLIAKGPVTKPTQFIVDSQGNPRYALSFDDHLNPLIYSRPASKDEWTLLQSGPVKSTSIMPLALSRDDKHLFFMSTDEKDGFCIYDQTVDTGDRKKRFCDKDAMALGAVLSFDDNDVIGALVPGATPWERLLTSDHPDRSKLEQLQKAFPGQIVIPGTGTADGSKAILTVASDRNPGDYYLFDTKSLKAEYLTSRQDWINPDQMSEQRAVQFTARDGQVIHGLLTIPANHEAKNLPLVVNPHGGPFGLFDLWGWSADSQLLASRGYAVLNINFRGSGGYSEAFLEAGKQHWDTVMIDDITDGTKWAIDQGIADPKRLCIYGASYGGYAALMSAVREPDLYRCAIGYAGVYDLKSWKKYSDVSRTATGKTFIDDFIGTTDEQLTKASPITYIDRLKANVMIVHGDHDLRVPLQQATELRAALDQHHLHYEWLIRQNEGHGFYQSKSREELYTKLLAFLDSNIGRSAKPAAAGGDSTAVVPGIDPTAVVPTEKPGTTQQGSAPSSGGLQ